MEHPTCSTKLTFTQTGKASAAANIVRNRRLSQSYEGLVVRLPSTPG
jgi:hypothetical protein